mmetsp:Transcript_39375/g.85676  ORF Transcript_39375/g.85676 Transcript_39375/m.85676 type:complete len:318 (-) Transcript_39375:373-1326(-)
MSSLSTAKYSTVGSPVRGSTVGAQAVTFSVFNGIWQRLRNFPENMIIPTMPKIKNINDTSTHTSINMGKDWRSVSTSLRMPSTPVTVRSGLNTRTVRTALTLGRMEPAIIGNSPSMTTVKSMAFHPSRRYVPFPTTNPRQTILSSISMTNATVNTYSIASLSFPVGESLKSGALESIARNRQLKRMSPRIVRSNSLDFTIFITRLRIGFSVDREYNARGHNFLQISLCLISSGERSTFSSKVWLFLCSRADVIRISRTSASRKFSSAVFEPSRGRVTGSFITSISKGLVDLYFFPTRKFIDKPQQRPLEIEVKGTSR